MNEELLIRLVDALEGINMTLAEIAVSLDDLDQSLTDCITHSAGGSGKLLCITGNVTTY